MSNTHEANIVRVGEILPHPNADKLELTMVNGYQVVIGKGSFKEGDLAVYVQPDSIVPQTEPFKFIWENHVGIDGKVPAKRRRITVKRLRKEYSEGLLMPYMEVLPSNARWEGHDAWAYEEGQDVAFLLGITHYVPEFDLQDTASATVHLPQRKYPKSAKGWFFFLLHKLGLRNAGRRSYAQEVSFDAPVYGVNALKNARPHETFRDGETVYITEKIHGSNARFVSVDGTFYVGSHQQWKMDGPNVWWNVARQYPQIEEFCHQNPGFILYGEVGPTQKGFRYGTEPGKTFFFAFDVFDPMARKWYGPERLGFRQVVPVLYVGPYSREIVNTLVDGISAVLGAGHIREGVVVSSLERRLPLKVVSNAYLLKEGTDK